MMAYMANIASTSITYECWFLAKFLRVLSSSLTVALESSGGRQSPGILYPHGKPERGSQLQSSSASAAVAISAMNQQMEDSLYTSLSNKNTS